MVQSCLSSNLHRLGHQSSSGKENCTIPHLGSFTCFLTPYHCASSTRIMPGQPGEKTFIIIHRCVSKQSTSCFVLKLTNLDFFFFKFYSWVLCQSDLSTLPPPSLYGYILLILGIPGLLLKINLFFLPPSSSFHFRDFWERHEV